MELQVTSEVMERMLAHALRTAPEECCGLLFGNDGRIDSAAEAPNVHPEPLQRFEIDPRSLIDAHRAMRTGGRRLVGYYHSHPGGAARPSSTDRALAAADGMIWAIVAGAQITFWRAGDGGMTALPYRLVTL